MLYGIVFLGAGIGGALRHGVNVAAGRWISVQLPLGTLMVNILGSFLMGLLAGYFTTRTGIGQHTRLFLTTGVLGGFTTFSTFTLDAALLIERNDFAASAMYVAGSVAAGMLALFAGLAIIRLGEFA